MLPAQLLRGPEGRKGTSIEKRRETRLKEETTWVYGPSFFLPGRGSDPHARQKVHKIFPRRASSSLQDWVMAR